MGACLMRLSYFDVVVRRSSHCWASLRKTKSPGAPSAVLSKCRGTLGMSAVRLDHGQDVGNVGVPLAAVEDGLQDLLGVVEPFEPVVDRAERRQGVGGLGVLADAQLGQLQRPAPVGVVGLLDEHEGQLVAQPGVAGRFEDQGLEDRLDRAKSFRSRAVRPSSRWTSIDVGSSLAAASTWAWASSARPCSSSHDATPIRTFSESGAILTA